MDYTANILCLCYHTSTSSPCSRHSWPGPRTHRSYHLRPYPIDWEHRFHPQVTGLCFSKRVVPTTTLKDGIIAWITLAHMLSSLSICCVTYCTARPSISPCMPSLYSSRIWPGSSDLVLPNTWYCREYSAGIRSTRTLLSACSRLICHRAEEWVVCIENCW